MIARAILAISSGRHTSWVASLLKIVAMVEESTSPPRKRRRLNAQEKLEIVAAARATSVQAACAKFNVVESSICDWTRLEFHLAQLPRSSKRRKSPSDGVPPTNAKDQPTADRSRVTLPIPVTTTSTTAEISTSSQSGSSNYLCRGQDMCSERDDTLHPPTSASQSSLNENSEIAPTSPPTGGNTEDGLGEETREAPGDGILIGIHGEDNGFADIAAHRTFNSLRSMDASPPFDLIGYPHVVHMLEALAKLEIDYAIVATDTIVSPITTAALDRIVSLRLELVGEVSAEETVCLCALPGTKLRDADCVMSDHSLLSRCEEYILQLEGLHKQDILRQVTWDSVMACRIVQEEQAQNTLVLCSRRAAAANGLEVLVDRVAASRAVSAYTVIGRRNTPPLPFEGLAARLASSSARRQWTVLLFTSNRPHLTALLLPFAYLNLDIQHFSIRNKSGDSAWTCVVSFCCASDVFDEAALDTGLAEAAVEIVHLGCYHTCTL